MSAELLTVGQSVPIYGIEKATGALRFPADINLPNMLWMKILRSPHAHARIVAVDATAAEKISGVAAVITHKDVPHVLFGPYQNEIYPLDEEIRFVGDTVAAVAARDWNVAEEAIRALRVTYEVLPAVHDPDPECNRARQGRYSTILKVMSSSPATSGPTSLELWATSSD